MDKTIILHGVITSGLTCFCLIFFLFNMNKLLINTIPTFILVSLAVQFVLSILYLSIYRRFEKDYKTIYYINFIINILTFGLYTYYLISIQDLNDIFTIYLIYIFSSIYWMIVVVKKVCKRGVYKIISSREECSICYEENNNPCVVLKCKHLYHKECIDKWLQEHTTCPQCRYDLV
jgi:amino acid transporter